MPTTSFSPGSEYITHTVGVRLRLTGTGSLNMSIIGLDDVRTYTMMPLTMSMTPGLEPTRQCNFKGQRPRIRFGTTEIDEYFRIARIVIFIKPSATMHPM